jgi:hypothetical protein
MKQQEELERLDRFMKLVEDSGWQPSRNERPPVLTPEDEEILSRAWAKVAMENELEALTDLITDHWRCHYGQDQQEQYNNVKSLEPEVSIMPEDISRIQERLKQLTDNLVHNATKIGEKGIQIMSHLNLRAEFELGGIYNLPDSFIEGVIDTLSAVDRFEEIEPDGHAFNDIIPDSVIQETKRLVVDTYTEVFKLYFRLGLDTPETELPDLDVFPGNCGHCTIAIYLDGFDTVEIDVTDTEYHLYILHDPIQDEWIVEENIISRPQLFETLTKHLTFYLQRY